VTGKYSSSGVTGAGGKFLYGSALAITLYLPFSAPCNNSALSSKAS